MTRPDARLLVPVSALPRVPEGARRWRIVCAEWVHTTEFPYWSGDLLDLSRPDVVDGVPVRLDALAWALGVLGWICVERVGEAFRIVGRDPTRGAPWPDLADLSDDDASRAVVAAALRGGA